MKKIKTLRVDDLNVDVHFKQIKRLYLKVKPDGRILVCAPMRTSTSYLKDFLRERRRWIEANREKMKQQSAPIPSQGETLLFGQLVPKKMSEAQLQQQLECKISHYYHKYWPYFKERHLPNVEIKYLKMSSTWGVCRPTAKTITFNRRLVHQPEAFVEYVVVHELCHLLICNHSKAFYELVERLLPDYKRRKQSRLLC